MVQSGGCCSEDFRDVFRINIEKRVRSLPDIDSLKISKDTVLTLWMSKFDAIYRGQDQDQDSTRRSSRSSYITTSAELIMSKEQLYDMFQNILAIKKFEHQMIFNSAQVRENDNGDISMGNCFSSWIIMMNKLRIFVVNLMVE